MEGIAYSLELEATDKINELRINRSEGMSEIPDEKKIEIIRYLEKIDLNHNSDQRNQKGEYAKNSQISINDKVNIGNINKSDIIIDNSKFYYKQNLAGGNALEIDDSKRQGFIDNFIALDFGELMAQKPTMSYDEFKSFVLCCLNTFCVITQNYFMGFMMNEPIFKCYDELTKSYSKCSENAYCSNKLLNHAEWPYRSTIQEHNLICGDNIGTRHFYENMFFIVESYAPMILQPLSDVFGRKKAIICSNLLSVTGLIFSLSTNTVGQNLLGYSMAITGSNVGYLNLYLVVYETLSPYKKYSSSAGATTYFCFGTAMLCINLVTLKLTYWKDAVLWQLFFNCIALICTLFIQEPLINQLKKGRISKFLENLYQICKKSNNLEIYDNIVDKIDPEKQFRTVKKTKLSKNMVFKDKVSVFAKRFLGLRPLLTILALGYLQGSCYLVMYLIVLSQNNIGLEKPQYTGILLGACTAITPLLNRGLMIKVKRVVFLRYGFLIMIAGGILIQFMEYIGNGNEVFQQVQSLIGAFLFKGTV